VDESRDDTLEDWSVTDPAGRSRLFGQWDHVRMYGRNFPDLLRAEGWEVDVRPMRLTAAESARYGIPEHEQNIYLGHRHAAKA
jgi:hypothetical protein